MRFALELFGDALALVAIVGTLVLFLYSTAPLQAVYEKPYEARD